MDTQKQIVKDRGILGLPDMFEAWVWVWNDDLDEEGCSPIFASLLYG